MKKLALALATLGSLSLASIAANATLINGSVIVNNTSTSITGQFNVDTKTVAGHDASYIWTNGYANSSVGFGGYDAVNGRSFYCTVAVGDPLYAAAVDIRNGAGAYTYLRVNKSSDSSKCTSIFVLKDSRRHY